MTDQLIKPITTLACYVSGMQALKDRSWKITLTTNELPPAKLVEIAEMQNKFGVVAFKESEFQHSEITALDAVDTDLDGGKSPSQRLRNVFYKLFMQDNEGFSTFRSYYESKMEKLLTHYKGFIIA